jgi:hypothetical protein
MAEAASISRILIVVSIVVTRFRGVEHFCLPLHIHFRADRTIASPNRLGVFSLSLSRCLAACALLASQLPSQSEKIYYSPQYQV